MTLKDINVGDRLSYRGSVWQVKEIHPESVVLGIGASDFVAVGLDELLGYEGDMPYAEMKFKKLN